MLEELLLICFIDIECIFLLCLLLAQLFVDEIVVIELNEFTSCFLALEIVGPFICSALGETDLELISLALPVVVICHSLEISH